MKPNNLSGLGFVPQPNLPEIRTFPEGGRLFYYSDVIHRVACANCQAICAPTLEERKARFRMLRESGVVVQNEDGSLEGVHPDEAKKRLKAMPPERRRLYEDDAVAAGKKI